MAQLTPAEQQLIEAIYFDEMPAIKRHFREQHGMNGATFESSHFLALGKLKAWLGECRISSMADFL